jgi:hypothetical protein
MSKGRAFRFFEARYTKSTISTSCPDLNCLSGTVTFCDLGIFLVNEIVSIIFILYRDEKQNVVRTAISRHPVLKEHCKRYVQLKYSKYEQKSRPIL